MEACNFIQVLCWYCILNAFKIVYLILTRGHLQTVEVKPGTTIDVGSSIKQTTH